MIRLFKVVLDRAMAGVAAFTSTGALPDFLQCAEVKALDRLHQLGFFDLIAVTNELIFGLSRITTAFFHKLFHDEIVRWDTSIPLLMIMRSNLITFTYPNELSFHVKEKSLNPD